MSGRSAALAQAAVPVREEPLAEVAYVYDGTTEGLLTAVFAAYANHEDPQDLVREGVLQPRLGQSTRHIETDPQLARRVLDGVRRDCGDRAADAVLHASLSDDPQAGGIVYRFIRYAMPPGSGKGRRAGGKAPGGGAQGGTQAIEPAAVAAARPRAAQRRSRAIDEVTHPAVAPLLDLDRAVMNERHNMMQFLRFEHLEGGLWFARCEPKASVVPLLMGWFSGRFNTQPFIIHDERHGIAGVYEGHDWYLVRTDELQLPGRADEEREMQEAWRAFYDAISIEARYNPELRRQLLPKRFWKNLTEMQESLPGRELQR